MFGKAIRSVVAGGVLALAAVVFAVPSWAAVSKRPTPTPTATPAPAQVQWGQFQLNSLHTAAAEGSIRPPLQQVWRARTPGTTAAHGSSGPVIAGDIAIAEGASTVYAMNLSAGELAWQIPRKVGPISTPAVATIGGRDVLVYTEGATSSDSAAVAIDIADRSELWRQPLKAVSASGVSVSGGEVYLRGLTVSGGTQTGVVAENGAVLRMDREGGRSERQPSNRLSPRSKRLQG